MPTLLLIDGHSLAYRAFYALPTDLATKAGTVTNAVYGFTSMLVKVLTDEAPDYIAVAFDAPGPTFRDAMDSEYKAGRKETPAVFAAQLPLIREVLDTLRIPVLNVEGVEADDVIATLTTQADDAGLDVVVVTGDRDTFQLVHDPHVKVLYNKRGVSDYALYDEVGIKERTGGVTPAQYPDYAALRGDTSDNLPGVPGIGEKTAAKLVTTYGTVEGILEHLDELPPSSARTSTRPGNGSSSTGRCRCCDATSRSKSTSPRCSNRRSTVKRPASSSTSSSSAASGPASSKRSATRRPRRSPTPSTSTSRTSPTRSTPRRDSTRSRSGGRRVALEARWESKPGGAVAGLALADDSGDAWYLPGDLLRDPDVAAAGQALVGVDGPPLVVHRAKELMHGLGDDLRALQADTALMAYLLDPAEGKYRLEDLTLRYLSLEVRSPDEDEGRLDLDGQATVVDTGRRAVAVLRLADVLAEALDARELTELHERIERPLVRVLAKMEDAGILVDRVFLDDLRAELATECDRLMRALWAHAGEEFNVNSTPQLRTVLFDKLGLTPVKKTKTGPSTDADSLQKMAPEHPIVEDLLRYREVEKLRSTYADALPPLIGPDGRIHATFKQTDTTTGRISSEAPNLQNVPVRTADGREFRRVFIAEPGWGLLTADYSQIELRVLAHLAEDPGLTDAFDRGVDIHTATAATVFHVPETEVDAAQRRFAKVVNYGLAYGMEAYGLGQRLGIPTEDAREILDAYFEGFPKVAEFMRGTVRDAKERGYTTTIFGRRRQITELSSDNFRIRQMGERMAQNAPVQGSAADIFKLAMIDVDRALDAGRYATRMLLTVHDELVFEVPETERADVEPVIRATMEAVTELRVPLVVDVGFGPNWAEAK